MTMKKRSAQTMLEMVIATGVIVVAVVSSTALIISTINAGRTSQNRIEAVNFAREGVEAVRATRDSNWLKRYENIIDYNPTDGEDRGFVIWDDSGDIIDGYVSLGADSDGIPETKYYHLEFSENKVELVGNTNSETVPIYYYASDPAYYTQACEVCELTKFSRLISIIRDDSAVINGTDVSLPSLEVTVTVTWTERSGAKEVTAVEKLYEWR